MSWRLADIATLADDAHTWRELAATQHGHPFLDPDLVLRAARHFGTRPLLGRYVVNGATRAFVVLDQPGAWSAQTFAPAQVPYALFLADRAIDTHACLRELFAALGPRRLALTLLHFDPRYASLDERTAASARRTDYATTISIEGHASFDAYAASRSKKLRDNMKRYQKRMHAAFANVELKVITAVDAMASVVRQHGDLEARGWKGREGSAVSQQESQVTFYTEALEHFARLGGAFAFQLHCNGEVVASRFGIAAGGVFVFLKTAYAEEHRALAPGRVLQWLAVAHVIDHVKPDAIEFYTKADVDQLQWGTSSRMIEHVEIARSPLVAKGIATLRAARNSLRRPARAANAEPAQPTEAPAPAAE